MKLIDGALSSQGTRVSADRPRDARERLTMLRLYDSTISGNCYKVRLLLAHLGQPYDRVDVDVLSPDSRDSAVLTNSPTGRVPLLEPEDGRFLAESNAILFYLAEGSEYLSSDRYLRGKTLQWMFFEQNHHEPNIAVARFIVRFLGSDHPRAAALPRLIQGGNFALERMNKHLESHAFFVGDRFSIADIALYAYTHNAHEGNFDLARYPEVRHWITKVGQIPNHTPME
jgi:glutathione S-transferase